ncbi:hypothetical protein GJV26_01220 [Massilia dura]|uniref:Uncharacterized protein n=1 Tax=Pseudoduganella dura TaxID=321982 RepID=A0A6I3X2R4_9BURK|nr:hypothetical protein [Pseudoduganella dura]MUI11119.1 hypothetical protein [Pseudoduganella dura]GGY10263.1 hypothetical protein GCM10007386_45810 [Pseudoduganella dura]
MTVGHEPGPRRREPSLHGGEAGGAPVAACCGDAAPPAGATVVVFGADGQARRPAAFGARATMAGKGETAWWFDSGPHTIGLVPFAGAPELGLRLAFVVDAADPRLARQRFDLFLFSEVAGQCDRLPLGDLAGRIELALRAALDQGTLDLPPCTSLAEWNAFRAGLDELLYMRFGITVDDCVPVELDDVDFAGMLRGRAAESMPPRPAEPPEPLPPPVAARPPDPDDAAALRRLFLELPDAARALRSLPAPAFALRQALLQRLALAALDVNTMPALAWSAPGHARGRDEQRRLGGASAAAARALDELWAQFAAMKRTSGDDTELERIVANLAFHLAGRRADAAAGTGERREIAP